MSASGYISGLLRASDGPLTRQLVQEPGRFGLGMLPKRLAPDETTSVVCGFCSTGCALDVHLRDKQAINISATADYPVNLGMACPKGWEALAPLAAPDRATTPLLRGTDGRLVPCDWERAMSLFTGRLKGIIARHGGEAVAWLGTGQMPSEELAFLGALGRFGMGIRHGDGNTRQCMATAVSAYKECFGFDAPPFTYADLEESDVLVFIGSNLCIAHPILWQRVMRNPHHPDILVLDPRHTETAAAATVHYPLAPKSDLALLYGLANLLVRMGAVDRGFVSAHTSGFEEFERFVARFPPEEISGVTGLGTDAIEDLARRIACGKRVSFWWTMGVNQGHQATRTAQAIIALALMTGNIGRPGTGANSITGQCNAMGSRLFSNTTSLFGGRDFASPRNRDEVARILDIPPGLIPDSPGYAYDQIVEAIHEGKIKALWVIATNPAHSWVRSSRFAEAARKLEFLVVQDMYDSTETARFADLVLPAAGWGEKDGTFVNSERRIGLIKKVSKAPGQALSDFRIFQIVAHYWGCGRMFAEWSSPEAVFGILQKLSVGRPCDITGIDGYAMIERGRGIQWPFDAADAAQCEMENAKCEIPRTSPPHPSSFFQERRLFSDRKFFTADQRARFVFEKPTPMPELPDATYPFLLLTGRGSSAQWHTQTRTGKSDVLRKLHPSRIYAEINPDDAARLGIIPGGRIRVRSRRGELAADALLTLSVLPGQIFVPMHFQETNRLTQESFDPVSRQPAYKSCAVALSRLPARS
ncbi:MAG: nitrate reductase [Terrimicrobiaceae bacterium]